MLKIASDEIDRQASFLAVQLLDCLMVNCGYPVRFYMTRKEYLNLLVKRFPPSPSVKTEGHFKIFIFDSVSIRSCHEENFEIDKQVEIIIV